MAPFKKGNGINTKSNASTNPDRALPKRQSAANMRDKSTIKRLKMYKSGGAIRNKGGKVIGGSLMMANTVGGTAMVGNGTARIQPDRRWFGNTRLIGQKELETFRNEMTSLASNPTAIVLRTRKLPLGLMSNAPDGNDPDSANVKLTRMKILETETYESVFSAGRRRKHAKLPSTSLSYETLTQSVADATEAYVTKDDDCNIETGLADFKTETSHDIFAKGQSKRIWGELYKVLDCSDVVLQVLDARNVAGTRSSHIENHLRKNAKHKHLIFIINKCDLVPNWVTKKWVRQLAKIAPTLVFHASMNNPFGKGALINLLRQFSRLHQDKKQISVGVIGFPNVGKSSVINALMKKKVCKVAPIPGETKVWQYITLMRRIFLIDCPGVVHNSGDSEIETVLKGVIRSERLPEPTEFMDALLARVKPEYLTKVYGIPDAEWSTSWELLEQLARKWGKLLPKGEPDVNCVAVTLINDYQRGKLPWFLPPPEVEVVEEMITAPLAKELLADPTVTMTDE